MLVAIKGAGDLASGVAIRLFNSGFQIVMSDLAHPTAIRRTVSFSEAILTGETSVEGITARRADSIEQALEMIHLNVIPVLADPDARLLYEMCAPVLIDAVLAKRNTGTAIGDAPVVIALGPGFCAGVDCHAVIETMRGHYLGRVIYSGTATPNTGVPGDIGGYTLQRIIRSPIDGTFHPLLDIGAIVDAGDTVATVDITPVVCEISGVLRGILPEGTQVFSGMKSGDVDPRCEVAHCFSASDKARSIGGGVLEAMLHLGGYIE